MDFCNTYDYDSLQWILYILSHLLWFLEYYGFLIYYGYDPLSMIYVHSKPFIMVSEILLIFWYIMIMAHFQWFLYIITNFLCFLKYYGFLKYYDYDSCSMMSVHSKPFINFSEILWISEELWFWLISKEFCTF